MDNEFQTFGELLRWRAAAHPDRGLYTFLANGEVEARRLSFGELDRQARVVAAHLRLQVQPGDRALLIYPPGIDYIIGFFGCLYAGVIAVPAYPPDPARIDRTLPRLQAITADSGARILLSIRPIRQMAQMLFAKAPDLQALPWLTTDQLDEALAADWQPPAEDAGTIAFLQYTSGSTRTPKGVMLSHGNLLHNAWRTSQMMAITADSRVLSWLPPYHDMGLIGMIMQPVFSGCDCILMSPLDFLKRPLRWLRAVSKYRATVTGGPNFAFDLCVRKFQPEQEPAPLDLSSLNVLFNGAEPIRAETVEHFYQTFAPYGFELERFYPCYGLAEGTLIASGVDVADPPDLMLIDKTSLRQDHVRPGLNAETSILLVGSGRSLVDQRIVVVDPETRLPLDDDQVGEIWIHGRSVAQGYWQLPAETAETFGARLAVSGEGPFLRTGDLGFFHAGEIYITGRQKDLLIINGKNHYPQDIELTVERSHPALRPGCGAAFPITIATTERLVIVQEVAPPDGQSPDYPAIIRRIRQAVSETHDLEVHGIVLIQPRSIFKTSSGKIQRFACRQAFLDDTLEVVAQDVREAIAPEMPALPVGLLHDMLVTVDPPQRRPLLLSYLRRRFADVLELDVAQLDPALPLSSFGISSVKAVELSQHLEPDVGRELPATLTYDYPTVNAICDYLLHEVLFANPEVDGLPAAGRAAPADDDVETMSDEDAEAALLRELGQS